MVVWSQICQKFPKNQSIFNLLRNSSAPKKSSNALQVRFMSGHDRTMNITPSRWQWHKFKDQLHFYVLVGAIPLGLLITYCNVFIGPATLSPIPEGYEPKHWEYYKSPISRFFARYFYPPPQQAYEIMMHNVYEQNEKKLLRILEKQVNAKIKERKDYQAYYYIPVTAKYLRVSRDVTKQIEESWGEDE